MMGEIANNHFFILTSQLHKISELYKMPFFNSMRVKRQKETKSYLSRVTFSKITLCLMRLNSGNSLKLD
jgi:hypothetical protein